MRARPTSIASLFTTVLEGRAVRRRNGQIYRLLGLFARTFNSVDQFVIAELSSELTRLVERVSIGKCKEKRKINGGENLDETASPVVKVKKKYARVRQTGDHARPCLHAFTRPCPASDALTLATLLNDAIKRLCRNDRLTFALERVIQMGSAPRSRRKLADIRDVLTDR